jgi:hypothetical protein
MKIEYSVLALASMLAGQICTAQTHEPSDDWKPATSNQQGLYQFAQLLFQN